MYPPVKCSGCGQQLPDMLAINISIKERIKYYAKT
jgi:hypothetical protein